MNSQITNTTLIPFELREDDDFDLIEHGIAHNGGHNHMQYMKGIILPWSVTRHAATCHATFSHTSPVTWHATFSHTSLVTCHATFSHTSPVTCHATFSHTSPVTCHQHDQSRVAHTSRTHRAQTPSPLPHNPNTSCNHSNFFHSYYI